MSPVHSRDSNALDFGFLGGSSARHDDGVQPSHGAGREGNRHVTSDLRRDPIRTPTELRLSTATFPSLSSYSSRCANETQAGDSRPALPLCECGFGFAPMWTFVDPGGRGELGTGIVFGRRLDVPGLELAGRAAVRRLLDTARRAPVDPPDNAGFIDGVNGSDRKPVSVRSPRALPVPVEPCHCRRTGRAPRHTARSPGKACPTRPGPRNPPGFTREFPQ